MTPTYVACFEGQGGAITSPGIVGIAAKLRAEGINAHAYEYEDWQLAYSTIEARRTISGDEKIALIGYSLGCSTATWLQSKYPIDLLLCIAESSWGQNYPINKKNTRRAILWYGDDWLSDAGVSDPGWDAKHHVPGPPVPVLDHLLMDVLVMNQVIAEINQLAKAA